MSVEAAGFLLAGGKSTRMGRDKALLSLDGETLVEIGLRKLRAVCGEVAIAGGGAGLERFGRVVADLIPECGPLGAIVSALERSASEWNLFLAVDMPLVPEEVLRQVLSCAGGAEPVVLAQSGARVQPLCGVYARRALPVLGAELAAGRLKMKNVAALAGARYVQVENEDWFRNLNTPGEFEALRGL